MAYPAPAPAGCSRSGVRCRAWWRSEPAWCRVTDHLSVCAGHRSASRRCISWQYSSVWAARCALRCAPMAARSLRHLIGDATLVTRTTHTRGPDPMKPFAAIDQGTTSTRVLLAGAGAAAQVLLALRHGQHYPPPGWVEHAPLEIWANVQACLHAAGQVQAIGIANQGESCLAWDARSGAPLSPVIVWQDNRTEQQLAQLRAEGAQALT